MKPEHLQEHPEGGRFLETFRSAVTVSTREGREKPALTHIYYSLNQGEVSTFHKVDSDEIWNLYQGSGLYLHLWDGTESSPVRITLSAGTNCFCSVVPAGTWQAAEPIADTVLMGCTVAPGFEFSDFSLLEARSSEAELLLSTAPDMVRLIKS